MRSSVLLLAALVLLPVLSHAQSTEALQTFGSAVADSQKGSLIDALEGFNQTLKIIERDPASDSFTAKVHYNIGVTLYNLGLLPEAKTHLKKALRYSKNRYVEAHYVLGLTNLELNRIEDAERSFRSSVVLDNRNGDAWYDLGRTYLALGDVENAKHAFAKALKNGKAFRGTDGTTSAVPRVATY
ncbi:MAG TPA: tetratricopeptide repeat protein [Pyrinomonadaceae bacterium]